MRKVLVLLGIFALLALWACHLGPEADKNTFDVAADTAWTRCDTVLVVLLDGDDEPVDTLFQDSLKSIDQLRKLDAEKYKGGKGGVRIKGTKDGGLCFEQKRTFEDGGANVKVDTLRDPAVAPSEVSVRPDSLVLTMGSPAASLVASVLPAYADPTFTWSVDGSGVVVLEGLVSGQGNPARVKPVKAGRGVVTARSAKDTTKSFSVPVRVVATSTGGIQLNVDTVFLYERGIPDSLSVSIPGEYTGQTVDWKTGDPAIATIDAKGRIKPVKAGQTHVQAILNPSGLSDAAVVLVKLDVPVLTVSSKPGAAVNEPIVFNPRSVQEFGTLVLFRWDLAGDGAWDDSLTTGWSGDTVDLPAVTGKYAKEGAAIAKFQVRDSEGNTAEAQVVLDIGNQAPAILALRKDTVISIKDSIAMTATAEDADGKVAWVGWDYEGDGQYDDSLADAQPEPEVEFARGHRYNEAGNYLAIFKAVDDNGKSRTDTVRIKVEFDEPVADAGPDFTVTAGADIAISVKGDDKFGPIAKRELKVGSGPFVALSKQDTSFKAPAEPTVLVCIIRVTDDDGLSDVDTVAVTVVLSSNADLSNLSISAGSLEPAFRSNATFYAARVSFGDSMVSITPTVREASTKITVNAKTTASGSASDAVKLQVGANANAFQIIVTAADGSQRLYTVSVTRDPNSEATLSKLEAPGLSLSPVFASSTLEYADTVGYAVASAVFKPTVASAGASLALGDSGMTSGTFTAPQPLQSGENVFKFAVTSQDGKTKTIYQVTIVRLGRLLLYRKIGEAAAVLIDSVEHPLGVSRPLSGPSPTGYRFVKWSLLEGMADLGDSAANPSTITLKSALVKVQAHFHRAYRMTGAVAEGQGTISPMDSLVDSASMVTWRFKPAAGYRILGIKNTFLAEWPVGTDSSMARTPKAGAVGDHHMAVHFRRLFNLVVNVGPGGKVNQASRPVDSSATLAFTATPDSGYRVDSVIVNGTVVPTTGLGTGAGSVSPQSWSVGPFTGPRVVRVVFRRVYTLKVELTGSGTVEPASVVADSGSSHTFTFKVGTVGHFLSALTDNGTSVVGAITGDPMGTATYKLENVNADHNLSGAFTVKTFTLKVYGNDICVRQIVICPGGLPCKFLCPIGLDSTTVNASYGSNWSISTSSLNDLDRPFLNWAVNGVSNTALTANPLTVGPITADVTYSARYQRLIIGPIEPIDPIGPIRTP